MPGIELEDIMIGISVCRNQNLANVFYRLNLIEAYGTGMRKIMKAYEGMKEKPKLEVTKNDVVGLLEVSASTATRVIRKMVKNNLLKQNGKARNTNYTIK